MTYVYYLITMVYGHIGNYIPSIDISDLLL